jgi:hypothetical protein
MGPLSMTLFAGLLCVLTLIGASSDLSSSISGMLTVLVMSFVLLSVLLTHSRVSGTAR